MAFDRRPDQRGRAVPSGASFGPERMSPVREREGCPTSGCRVARDKCSRAVALFRAERSSGEGVRQVPVLHLPGVVEHVVCRVAEQVGDRPVAERLALRVPSAHRLDEAVAVMGEAARLQQVLQLGLRPHALREVATLGRQDMPNDLVAGAAA